MEVQLKNYFDLLVDKEIDEKTECPICIQGISKILDQIHKEIKTHYTGPSIQRFFREKSLYGIYHWKKDWFPIPIYQLKRLLLLWQEVCNKSQEDLNDLYDRIYQEATHFKAKCSPIVINIVKSIDTDLAYLLGLIYADGALRNIWLTLQNEQRFRWEITITEELAENLQGITLILNTLFGIKTNVKSVYGGRWYRILFQSMILFRILNKVFKMPIGYKKGKLSIPKIIREAPFEIKKHFLIGFFDGDGWCSNFNPKKKFTPILAANQSSKKILEELNDILKEGGLNFHINIAKRDQHTWYNLVTKDKGEITRFQDQFGFGYRNKQERLKTLVNSFYNGRPKVTKISAA